MRKLIRLGGINMNSISDETNEKQIMVKLPDGRIVDNKFENIVKNNKTKTNYKNNVWQRME